MPLFKQHNSYELLPEVTELQKDPCSLHGTVEKRSFTFLGWRWKRHAAVLNKDGKLYIFKNYLPGIGAGKPYWGRIIFLNDAQCVRAKILNGICYMKIIENLNKRVVLRVAGVTARLWAAKLFMYEADLGRCSELEHDSIKHHDEKYVKKFIFDGLKEDNSLRPALPALKPSTEISENKSLTHTVQSALTPKAMTDIRSDEKDNDNSFPEDMISESSEESIISYDSTSKIFTSSDYPRSQFSYSESDLAILSNSDKLSRSRSLSVNQMGAKLVNRRERFRKHLQSMIDSRLYDSVSSLVRTDSVQSFRFVREHVRDMHLTHMQISDDKIRTGSSYSSTLVQNDALNSS